MHCYLQRISIIIIHMNEVALLPGSQLHDVRAIEPFLLLSYTVYTAVIGYYITNLQRSVIFS